MLVRQSATEAPLTTYSHTLASGARVIVTNVVNGVKVTRWQTFVFVPPEAGYTSEMDVTVLPQQYYDHTALMFAELHVLLKFGIDMKFSDIPF